MQEILDSIHNGVIVVDRQELITLVNRAAERLLKISRKEVLGKPIREVLPESRLHEVLATGRPQLNEKKMVEDKVLLINRTPFYKDGVLQGAVSIFQDITELETVTKELKQLRELKEELEAVFDASYDEIYVTDGEGNTTRINKVGESYYGVKAEEMIGKNVKDLEKQGYFSPSVVSIVLREKRRITIAQKTKSGKQLIVTANPVFDETGNIVRVVVNSRDITELTNLRQKLQETEQLAETYRNQIMQLTQEKASQVEIIAESPQMKQILDMVHKVAAVDSTILIMGESGVGKGILAQRIHSLSPRSRGPMITINCGAIPENLLESELFGYEPGAFTGARKEGKKGLLELGNGGTVFLDEIAELPLNLQVKLLQVIQEKKLLRVGGTKFVPVNIRIIAATNQDIQKLVKEGKFREDLYYRLNVIPIVIPPLRHRKEDIPPLINHFLAQFNAKYQINKRLSAEAMDILVNYEWKGNVREVENIVERLVVTTESSVIEPVHLPEYILNSGASSNNRVYVLDLCPLQEATEELERQLISKAYERYGNTYKVAEVLKVNQSTVVRKMKKYVIKKRSKKSKKESLSDRISLD
ncbi:sigma 54-interacting transcriptional regulator [Calderihabitans maritimus]|uniref:HTH-type transcriptional regulatory protein TyrR n=1 Tax=Calderihabitans maritimus TaxID=1246530 RepID=A0A1Z5HU35_9FIRM|nr:sigma 54-interacting transcriptional regulator [Calderihabitans maritimus]GAW93032.1 Fis family transcriptional regulator [Calderihabitans maritimus]